MAPPTPMCAANIGNRSRCPGRAGRLSFLHGRCAREPKIGRNHRMALFMDVHNLAEVSLGDVEKAHAADLEKQDEHGVHYLRYWVDEAHGKVFCLVDAPDTDAANTV